ncbi:MAG: peptidylprolyl isomerase, partial [Planctomycetota bacterium]
SKAQGGLLSPIRPEDTSYPSAMRQAIDGLEVGQVSQPIAIDGGFALLKLEEKIAAAEVEFDDVKDSLELAVRGRTERVLMQQLARELLSGAELVVLDPTLKALWEAQRESLLTPQ